MRRPIVAKQSLDLQSNHFLRRSPGYPLGISLGELDYLRGWKDDFLGDSLHEQYSIDVVGAGSAGALQDPAHGGVYRLTAGPASGRKLQLRLGGGYDTMDPDDGWIMGARMRLLSVASCICDFGAFSGAWADFLMAGFDSGTVANNWYLHSRRAAGAITTVDTGVAANTDWHWHWLDVSTSLAEYFLDGALIGRKTDNIPIIPLEPLVRSYARAAASKHLDLDTWIVIPRNL